MIQTIKLYCLFSLITIGLVISLNNTAYADDQFETNYQTIYTIQDTGKADITQNISIINRVRDVIATSYTATIKHMRLFDIFAQSKDIEIKSDIIENTEETQIKMTFEDIIIGQGKKLELQLKYNTFDIATKVGNVWSINIPKVNLFESTKFYDVTLNIPASFGQEIFISPVPIHRIEKENSIEYKFDINSLKEQAITGAFGKYQVLNFKLNYDLVNNSNFTTHKTIALPPDIKNMQQVAYKNINMPPKKIKVDADGNVLATYVLQPKEKKLITIIGSAQIFGKQIKPEYGGNINDIPKNLLTAYTKKQTYWEVDSSQIQEIVKNLFDKNLTVSQNAHTAYLFVLNNLKYDFTILSNTESFRKGAVQSLIDQKGTGCTEFTDLYITLLRAMGIPARELDGYAIATEDSSKTPLSLDLRGGDLLHTWVEFYDPKLGWVPVDPTWGQTSGIDYFTKLDTNHFVFSIKGKSSEMPQPAGAYKVASTDRYVFVDFANNEDVALFAPKLEVAHAYNLDFLKFLKGYKKYIINNTSNITLYVYDESIQKTTQILPSNKGIVYLKKNTQTILIKDPFNKTEKVQLHEIKEPSLKKTMLARNEIIFLVFFVMPVTCMIFYFLTMRLKYLKK